MLTRKLTRKITERPTRPITQAGAGDQSLESRVRALFANGEQGAWYGPGDFTRYMAGGPNLFPDPDWATLGGWEAVTNATIAVSGGEMIVTATGINPTVGYRLTTVIGKQYEVQITLAADAMNGNTFIGVGSGGGGSWAANLVNENIGSTLGRYSVVFTATTTDTRITVFGGSSAIAGETFRVTRPVVRELTAINTATLFQDAAGTTPVTALAQLVGKILDKSGNGNHASQPTAAARPVLSARKNLLTYTEDLTNAAWVKAACSISSPSAGVFKVTPDSTTAIHRTYKNVGVHTAGYFVVEVKADGLSKVAIGEVAQTGSHTSFDLSAGTIFRGTGKITALTDGWYRIAMKPNGDGGMGSPSNYCVTALPNSATGFDSPHTLTWLGNSVDGILVRKPHVESLPGSVTSLPFPTYQRVNTATDYDTTGFPHYLKFDGVDDYLRTTFPNLGSNVTIGRNIPGTGASILTGQTIGAGNWDDSASHCALVIIDRALTGPETALLTEYLNTRAGL